MKTKHIKTHKAAAQSNKLDGKRGQAHDEKLEKARTGGPERSDNKKPRS